MWQESGELAECPVTWLVPYRVSGIPSHSSAASTYTTNGSNHAMHPQRPCLPPLLNPVSQRQTPSQACTASLSQTPLQPHQRQAVPMVIVTNFFFSSSYPPHRELKVCRDPLIKSRYFSSMSFSFKTLQNVFYCMFWFPNLKPNIWLGMLYRLIQTLDILTWTFNCFFKSTITTSLKLVGL